MKMRICDCGSGQQSFWVNDADGIPLCRTCDACHEKKLARYRADILTVSSRHYGERVDEED